MTWNPNMDEAALIAKARTKKPYTAKAGRYLFFAICGFGVSLLVFGALRKFGFSDDIVGIGSQLATVVVFMALREMSKYWDLARIVLSERQTLPPPPEQVT